MSGGDAPLDRRVHAPLHRRGDAPLHPATRLLTAPLSRRTHHSAPSRGLRTRTWTRARAAVGEYFWRAIKLRLYVNSRSLSLSPRLQARCVDDIARIYAPPLPQVSCIISGHGMISGHRMRPGATVSAMRDTSSRLARSRPRTQGPVDKARSSLIGRA